MKRSYEKFRRRLEDTGLLEEIETRARSLHVTLAVLYDGTGTEPSVGKARKDIYAWLVRQKGLGNNEVARLFDRAPNGISKLIRRKGAR